MRKGLLIFVLVGFVQLCAEAQLTSLKVYYPEYLSAPTGTPEGKNRNQSWQDWCLLKIQKGDFGKPANKLAWSAFSDRNNNVTFSSPSSKTPKSNLSFGEKVYIAEFQHNMAHVFSTEKAPSYPDIPTDAIDKGWVNINNLLLWQLCPQNSNQIYQKGLVVQDVSKTKNSITEPPFLTNPDDNGDVTGSKARNLDILFVMKTAKVSGKKYYLLSKEYKCDKSYQLLGWLSEDYLTEWNHRLCLEPTSSNAAVNFYERRNLYPITFFDSVSANNFYDRQVINNKFATYDITTKYLDSYNMRLPILRCTQNNENIFYSAIIQESINNGNNKRQIEELKVLQQHINIIFVIDHTSSMKKYFSAVSQSVLDLINRDYNSHIANSDLKVGIVLYKDYNDAKTTNVCELNSDLTKAAKFLDDAKDKASSSDKDYEEAMFEGLRVALDAERMGYDKKHSNFIILLGDAGDHSSHNGIKWQDAADDIARRMNTNNINFLGYQVKNDGSDAGTAWGLQVARIQSSFAAYFNQTAKTNYKYCATNNNWWEFRKAPNERQYIRLATYKFVEKGTTLSDKGLKSLVSDNIDNFIRDVDARINMIDNQDNNLTTKNVQITEEDLRAMFRLLGWSDDAINRHLSKERADKFLAYVPSKIEGTNFKLFDYVLFFSQDELDRIYRELNKINRPDIVSKKTAFQDAVISMGVSILGEDASTIQGMDMNELLSRIYGVPIKISTTFKIIDIPYMKDSVLTEYIKDFNIKLEKLKSIKDSASPCRFISNNISYYWYPFKDVPGFVAE